MTSQLTRLENGWAVVIDQSMIDLLNIEPETLLEITTDGKVITVTPISSPITRDEFEAALAETNREFGNALRKLAE